MSAAVARDACVDRGFLNRNTVLELVENRGVESLLLECKTSVLPLSLTPHRWYPGGGSNSSWTVFPLT
jgi:hypothetical protein